MINKVTARQTVEKGLAPIDDEGRLVGSLPSWQPNTFGLDRKRLVPGERFELPTNGLQNRCSTTELTRQVNDLRDRS